ncbi:hypothetical protein Ga0074812_11531 [Parafrankia irregularis]|uniref:Uncharacterized protein n=1 Tax=Parafrankia irregularis TaxID=795642 RepID=A0A0S4QQD6_9ACTN|nr:MULTISPECIES: hypothetical protein [Parafrankia]MBE3202645.1 hypothetical protein [Parafrankia sp. CH37]CUU57829.1 hypothetical protein Ga0074812_11531 [Parafrankia irregularis]
MPAVRARSARPPTPTPALPGEIDPLITAAVKTFRGLTPAEQATVAGRHGAGTSGTKAEKICRGCQFRYRRGAATCPSVIYLNTGSYPRAAAAIPPTTTSRPCRICRTPVTVPVSTSTSDRPLCDSCQDQPPLFGADEAGSAGGAA